MSDTTQITKGTWLGKIGLNIPGAVLIMMVMTVCVISFSGRSVPEPLGSLTAVAVGYVFRRTNPQS